MTSKPKNSVHLSLKFDELKKRFTNYKLVATQVCAGNRRTSMSKDDPTIRGLAWTHGAISTAEWTGVRLADVLATVLLRKGATPNYDNMLQAAKSKNIKYVQFEGELGHSHFKWCS